MSERYEKGAAMFESVIGSAPPAEGPDFLKVTVESLFADVWARDGLPVRDRRLLTITVLATMCKRDSLEGHIRQALVSRDVSFAELQEVAIHLAHYAGWPVGQLVFDVAIRTAMELKAARDKSKT